MATAPDLAKSIERVDLIQYAMAELDPRRKRIVIEYYHGATDEEIAEELRISQGRAWQLRVTGLKRMRERLKDYLGADLF